MILSGKPVAEKLTNETRKILSSTDGKARMMAILIGKESSSVKYAQSKQKKANELNVDFRLFQVSDDLDETLVIQEISNEIKRYSPNGVLIERPIPEHINWERIQELIPANADIDCERFDNSGKLLSGQPYFIPATVRAVIEILQFYGISCSGKNVVIVGRSNVVGMPLAVLLSQKSPWGNATVTLCHTKTPDITFHTKSADIVIVCAGSPGLLKKDMVKDGVIVIDVGINVVGDKIVGDADFEDVSEKASAITPVPGGVGMVTTACLFANLALAVKNSTSLY